MKYEKIKYKLGSKRVKENIKFQKYVETCLITTLVCIIMMEEGIGKAKNFKDKEGSFKKLTYLIAPKSPIWWFCTTRQCLAVADF